MNIFIFALLALQPAQREQGKVVVDFCSHECSECLSGICMTRHVFIYTCSVYMCFVYIHEPAGNASSALLLVGFGDMDQQQPHLSSSCWIQHHSVSSKNPVSEKQCVEK